MNWIADAFQSILRKVASIPNPKVIIRSQNLPHYNSCKYPEEQLFCTDWLQYLPESMPVSTLSIPGTHNSATYHTKILEASFYSQCQSWTTYDQLRAGIRYLDIKVNSGKEIWSGNGVTFGKLEEEIEQISKFLKENQSEFVLIGFRQNNGGEDPSPGILKLLKGKLYVVFSKRVPTVGELRGKVWIISSSKIKFQFSPTYEMQTSRLKPVDHPQAYMSSPLNAVERSLSEQKIAMELKQKMLMDDIFKRNMSQDRLKIHLLRNCSVGRTERIYPCDLAKDESGLNYVINQTLQSSEKIFLGILVMDFPGQELINRIIQCNFR